MSPSDPKSWKPMFDLGESVGVNVSERILSALCRKSFLRLWAQTNVFTDEGFHAGRGSAKELCDALVVFGQDVIIFSDKHVRFQDDRPVEVAWGRWFRRAVLESIKQLHGAKNWLQRFPARAFLDAACQRPLPVAVPSGAKVTFHLIAVTRGTRDAAMRFAGGGRGTFAIRNEVVGEQNLGAPFTLGIPVPEKPFVHVFDEAAIELVLAELDTAPDFIEYLHQRERFLGDPKKTAVVAFGEEDLLAAYLQNMDAAGEKHQFLPGAVAHEGDARRMVVFDASFFDQLQKNKAYIAKKHADKVSYFWDELIERFVRLGDPNMHGFAAVQSNAELEQGLRLLASEPRLRRRTLSDAVKGALSKVGPGQQITRLAGGTEGETVYVFLIVPRAADESYEDYRKHRVALVHAYTRTAKLVQRQANVFVGLAFDNPYKDYQGFSEDLLVYSQDAWTDAQLQELEQKRQELGIWGERMQQHEWSGTEFPKVDPSAAVLAERQDARRQRKKQQSRAKMRKESQRRNRR